MLSELEFAFLFKHYAKKYEKELEEFSNVAKDRYFLPPGKPVRRRIAGDTIVAIIRQGWELDDEERILKGLKLAYVWADSEKYRLDIKAAIKDILRDKDDA